MSHLPPRGILRKTDRNINHQVASQSVSSYGPDEVYSHGRSTGYRSDPANMPIFSEDEDLIQIMNSKPQNINANLYAQALAAKSSLGLLDVGNSSNRSSALEALRSYDSHIESPLTSPEKKQSFNPRSSQSSRSGYQQTPGYHPSYYNDLEEEDLSPYKYTGTSRKSDPDHPVAFKPITDLNLNSVDDEDEFLYGDSNPLPSENSSFQNKTTQKIRSHEVYGSDELLDVETPEFDKQHKSFPFFKSKESNNDGKSGIKLSISTFKKRSSWNHNDNPILDNKSAKQEPSLTSKHYKESFDGYSNSPSASTKESYESHSYSRYNLSNQSRSSIPFKTSKESSLNFSELENNSKISDSSLNQSISLEDSSKNYEAAANLLRKQLNLDKSSKSSIPYEDEFYSKYSEPPQNERRVIYENEKKAVDKSSSGEPLKFPKLLINVQHGESSPSKRVVQVKDSSKPSSKYDISLTKSESSLMPTRNASKNEDLDVDKNVYESDDLGTRRVIRDKTKVGREPGNVGSKGETRVLPKRYIEKSHKKDDESSMKERLGEKLPKKFSDKYRFVKEGMESYYGYGSKSKSSKARSPERRWSPSYSPKRRSPSYSPRRWSPEYHRRRSPSYSPPSSHSRNRSPSYRHRDHSPSYRYHDTRRRSVERSSRRERRSRDRSPHGHSRHRSRGRSPSWPIAEKELQEDRKKERAVIKRVRTFSSEENSDDELGYSVSELSDKLKGKEPSKVLKESESMKTDDIFAKKRKMAISEESKKDIFQKSQSPDSVTKIVHGLGIAKKTSDPYAQNEKGPETTQDSPDSKEKRSEVMNTLLNKLGISSSISTMTTTVGPATSWTTGSTDSQAPVSATPQPLNVNAYHMPYPPQLASAVPQMYPQQYNMYRAAVPPASPFPPFNTPPPTMYVQPPISTTSTFNYPPPVPPVPSTYSSVNFQINPRAINPNSKGRISCLKPIPVVNSNQSMPQPSLVWNQNNFPSPTIQIPDPSNTSVKGVLAKSLSSASPETSNSPVETEENRIEKYKKLLEEKEIMQKKLKNTSDHIIEIRNLQAELEKPSKLPKSSASKQLNIKCSNLFDRTNEELKRYIEEAKRLNGQVKELQTKIKPETLDKIAKEISEKKILSSIKYAGYDAGSHWCESCNQHTSTIPKMIEHLHSETHLKHVDPLKVITKEPPKESFDKNVKLSPARGVEFVKPLYAFYCSLCNEILSNQSYAEYHLKGSSHIEKYVTFLIENPVYEKKREVFKEAAIVALANEKKQKDLEEIRLAKQLFKEKVEIKRQKKQDALKAISDKLQQLKDNDKVSEELEESNNARMSPQNQKSGLKLTLINEKGKAVESLEPGVAKGPEMKPKPKVVYIGRAPNYKPKRKEIEKKNSVHSENKNTDSYVKVEEGKNPNTSSKDAHAAPDFTVLPDEKIKNSKKLDGSTQNQNKNQVGSPKKIKKIPGCQSEAEAKESEKVGYDSDKHSIETSSMPTDNSEINEAIKNFIRNRKNATPLKVDDNSSGIRMPELPSKNPSPVSNLSPKKSSPFSESSPKVSSPLLKSSPKVSSPVLKSSPKVSSPLVSSPLQPLSEEEKDFLILGICKSDMEPLAVPRPPPSNLIHTPSDMVPKFQSFPPPVQIPPPNIISNVPPPNITSQVPPPNIISNVPPPNITSQVPPPTLVLQWSSEQNQQSSSVSISKQVSYASPVCENTGVMDMEIDNDLVCSEIKVGSEVSSAEKEKNVLCEPVMKELGPSLAEGDLSAKTSVLQVMDSDVVAKDDDRLLLKSFLNSLMDSVSEKVAKDSKGAKNSKESAAEKLLPSDKVTDSASGQKSSLNPSSVEQSVSVPESKNSVENSNVEKNEKAAQRSEQLVSVSSEIAVQDDDNKMCVNDPLIKATIQDNSEENNSKSFQEMEIEEICVIKEENILNLTSTSNTAEELHDVKQAEKPVASSCHSFKTETCKSFEQKDDILVSTPSEGGASTCDNENERNSISLNANEEETNVNSVMISSSSNTTSDVTVSSKIDVQYDNDEKIDINDPLIKDMIQDDSKENNSKCSQEVEVEEISVNKEEKDLILTSISKTREAFHDVKQVEKPIANSSQSSETETCESLEQNNNILVSTPSEVGASTCDNENEKNSISLNANEGETNVNSVINLSSSSVSSDVAVSSEIAVQYDNEKKDVNDPLIKDVIQNIVEEDNSKCSQEMEVEEMSVNKGKKNLNLALFSETAEELDVVKEAGGNVTNSCHSSETETCELSEQKNIVSTSSESRTSTNDNESNFHSLDVNQRENTVNSLLNSSSSNVPEEKKKSELSEDQLAVAKASPTSSTIKIEVKEEINDPVETCQLENLSCKQSAGTISETVDEVSTKSSAVTEATKLDQNFPVKNAESSQVQSVNDFTSENSINMKEDKEEFPVEDSKPDFKICDAENIVNKISPDGQSLLNESKESADEPCTEEFKGELTSDTDEYETTEN